MNLELKIGATAAEIAEIYADAQIVGRLSYDEHQAAPIEHPLVSYLAAYVDNEFAGIFMAIKFSKFEIEVHALLKQNYVKQSRELGGLFLDWAFKADSVQRVTAYIIGDLVTARNYVKKLGFKQEGVRRHACRKNGKPVDVYLMGILKDEWRGA